MKHPALARVFSIVLAILSVIMLLNGAFGFGKAKAEYQEELSRCQVIDERLASYIALDAKLKSSVSYEDAYAELEKLQEQHDADAAQHRTDLATHTATKGGYVLGADMITEGRQQLAAAKAELLSGKQTLAEQEQQFSQLMEAYNQAKPLVLQAIDQLNGSELEYRIALAVIDKMIAEIESTLDSKPQEVALLSQPSEPDAPDPIPEDADEESRVAYDQALLDYEQQLEEYHQAVGVYQAAKDEYTEYQEALSQWQQQVQATLASTDAGMAEAGSSIQAGNAQISAALSQLPSDFLDSLGSSGSGVTMPDLSGLSLEQRLELLKMVRAELTNTGNLPNALNNLLSSLEKQLNQAQETIAAAKRKIAAGELAMKKGEDQLQHQLELLWYNMGKLEDEEAELEEEKQRLDEEAGVLDKMLVSTDEKRDMENEYRSARLILMQEGNIKAQVNEGSSLVESTEAYLQASRAKAQQTYNGLLAVNILAVLGGVLGLLCIPSAFEKLRARSMLLLPALLCLLCSIGADGLNMALGLGQMYTALAAAIFALVYLLVVFPKDKTIRVQ